MQRRGFLSQTIGLSALGLSALPVASAAAAAAIRVVMVESSTTRKFFDTNLGKYDAVLAPWRNFATRQKLAIDTIGTDQVKTLKPGSVAILPSAVALTERERADLEAAALRGVNLLATWAFAPRDASGTWLGYGLMKSLFDAEVIGDIKPDSDERFLQTFAESPITHSLPPAKRIFLGKAAEPLLRATTNHPVARFSDWMRSAHKDSVNHFAASYVESGRSRRVWFGFPESSWETAQADIDLMLLDTLNWLQRKPVAVISNWPAPFQGAFLLEMDTEDKFPNALLFEEELTKRGLRGTFYCLTEQAIKFPDVVKKLAQNHEIAYHADIHTGFRGQDLATQQARLQKMIQEMGKLISDPKLTTGFRAPLEEFDATTDILLRKLGLRHHAATPDFADIAAPMFSKVEPGLSTEDALVLLPRTMLDDVNFQRMGVLEKSVSGLILNSAKTVMDARGFGLLSLHTQNYGAGSALQREVPKLLDFLATQKERVWVASGDQIERWWREKHRLSTSITQNGGQMDIKLTVNAPGQVRNAQMILMSPIINQTPKVLASVGARLQKLDDQRHALIFPELKTGVHSIRVSFA
jgi:peptidoglycan/xylan/chitin deacetylase (PgdA/CDA1 family)